MLSEVRHRNVGRLAGIAAINAAVAIFSGFQSQKLGNNAFLAESSHSTSDTLVTSGRATIETKDIEYKRSFQIFRRTGYCLVSGFGLFAATKSGIDFVKVAHDLTGLNNISDRWKNMVAAGVNAAGNYLAFSISTNLEGQSPNILDAKRHARLDRNTSFALAGAIAVGTLVPLVAESAGVMVGGYTAWHMRPTEHNLEHHG